MGDICCIDVDQQIGEQFIWNNQLVKNGIFILKLMQFTSIDALLLHAIYVNEIPGFGATLLDIIGYGDYIDHSVLEYAEMSASLAKLLPVGLVVQLDKKLGVTVLYRTWWDATFAGKTRIDVQKALLEIKTYLNSTFETSLMPEVPVMLNIQPMDFSKTLDIYLKRPEKPDQ